MESRLLNAADMGAGWMGTTVVSSTELGTLAESPCPGVSIDASVTARLRPVVGVRLGPVVGVDVAVAGRGVGVRVGGGTVGTNSLGSWPGCTTITPG